MDKGRKWVNMPNLVFKHVARDSVKKASIGSLLRTSLSEILYGVDLTKHPMDGDNEITAGKRWRYFLCLFQNFCHVIVKDTF
jgi:hypothetical protein